jgi:hypothetical protein
MQPLPESLETWKWKYPVYRMQPVKTVIHHA